MADKSPLRRAADLARELGVSRQRFHGWTKRAGEDPFPDPEPGVPGPVWREAGVLAWVSRNHPDLI